MWSFYITILKEFFFLKKRWFKISVDMLSKGASHGMGHRMQDIKPIEASILEYTSKNQWENQERENKEKYFSIKHD